MPTIPSFKDMPIWQRAMQIAVDVYQLTSQLPPAERLGICSNLQQAVVAIPTGLASGTRSGRAGFRSACVGSRESTAEVETLLLIVQQTYPSLSVGELLNEIADLDTALTLMIKRLSPAKQPPKSV